MALDGSRKIVQELHYGEAFKLLIVNMLAAVLLLLVLTLMGIAGTTIDTGQVATRTFESWYEWVGISAALELVLSGFFFGIAMYKVAAYE